MKLEVSRKFKEKYSEKLMDLANFSLVGLTFASIFSEKQKIVGIISGVSLYILFLPLQV